MASDSAFGCMAVINAADNLWMLPDILWYLEEIIPLRRAMSPVWKPLA